MKDSEFIKEIASAEGKDKFLTILKYAWFLRQKEPEESAVQASKVLEYALEQKDNALELKAITYLCYACYYASNMEATNNWIDKLQHQGMKYSNNSAIGTAYSMRSRIYLQQGNTAYAMENALTALEYNLKDNNPEVLTTSYFSLGMIHLRREENTEAKHYLQLALQNAEVTNNHTQYSIRVNIGNLLYNEKKFDDALNEYLTCLPYFQEHDMVSSTASVLLNIGICHKHSGNYEAALANMMKAYNSFEKMKNLQKTGFAANAIAEIYILQKDWDNALIYLNKAEKVLADNNNKIDLVGCYSNYIQYHEKRKEYIKANQYLHKMMKLKDKLNAENQQEKLSVLETKYKTEIYRLKSAELSERNRAIDNQNKQLSQTLEKVKNINKELQQEFQEVVNKLNAQDDLLTSKSRMAMMGELISAIAHQWKQPLNVIWVMVQAIGEAWDFEELDDEFMTRQLDRIGEQVMYMSETVNDFRNYFNKDYILTFKVADTIDKSINLVSYMFNKDKIKLIKELDSSCHLNGNPNELSQVVINILNNASDAIKNNQINEPWIKVSLTCDESSTIIRIYNKGKQIEQENLDKIFESYFTTKGKEGTGIGLSICRRIIEQKFGGSLIAQNLSDGVQFEISIPKT